MCALEKKQGGPKGREFWNAKARTFPRFEEGDANYEARMLRLATDNGVDFRGKDILDVGSGSGMYTIRLARAAASVVAVDISDEMLRILEEDARQQHIHNITCVHSSWDDFSLEQTFDVVFASMTPAIDNDESSDKLMTFAHNWVVFMGFSDSMRSDVLAGLFTHYHLTPRVFNNAQTMRHWLERRGFAYKALPVTDQWVVPHSQEKLLDSCLTTLRSYEVEPDEELVREHIEAFRDDQGQYIERTDYSVEMIVWQKK
ncbi:MAG: class I SAM-dependent methyltransferase [Desulfovibrionales bacterium]|nr:class I SAM-dependent methyltransferase [Desulfovibrionales bacterium]